MRTQIKCVRTSVKCLHNILKTNNTGFENTLIETGVVGTEISKYRGIVGIVGMTVENT